MPIINEWADETRCPTWSDLLALFVQADTRGWVFRGQADSRWTLTTRLERELPTTNYAEIVELESAAVGFFKERAQPLLAEIPGERDGLGWLALMQHYGAPTRLLDWTESPFIACFFALGETNPAPEAAIWCLDAWGARNIFGTPSEVGRDHLGTKLVTSGTPPVESYPGFDIDWSEEENRFFRQAVRDRPDWPLPFLPPRTNPRLAAQQAVFTCDGALNGGPSLPLATPGGVPMLKKVLVPRSWRQDILDSLRLMGISADSLFPGLDGIGRATSLRIATEMHDLRDFFERSQI